ncbi:MAG TPA: helix-turn-helix transcriptional regulator, partial [Thermoanaerobaculia bacterium]|nr:helix-turn-helix transcriptional regulator [Thermoanaerobaculia bacterium]
MNSDNDVPPVEPGPSFGEELRKEREIRGISLAEIAEATKVSKRFLGAIENDDFATLPAPVFTRGFVREYARYLGLNAEEMVTRYAHFLDAQGHAVEDDPLPLRSSDKPPTDTKGSEFRRSLIIGGIVLLLIVLV